MEIIGRVVLYNLSSTRTNLELEDLENVADELNIPMSILPNADPITISKIRKSLKRVFKQCFGIDIRKNGGVVFIPLARTYQWDILKRLFISTETADILEFDICEDNKLLVSQCFDRYMKDFFYEEAPTLLDKDGKFKLPRVRIDVMNCLGMRFKYMLDMIDAYSKILGEKCEYEDKIKQLYTSLQVAIEKRMEEIEEERLYGY